MTTERFTAAHMREMADEVESSNGIIPLVLALRQAAADQERLVQREIDLDKTTSDYERCDIEVRQLRERLEAAQADVDRINWLATNPRGAEIVVEGVRKPCVFWGVSSAPEHTLREAIDAARNTTREG